MAFHWSLPSFLVVLGPSVMLFISKMSARIEHLTQVETLKWGDFHDKNELHFK
ncbi:MAG: hypothetical protein ACTSVE_02405 [Candidatus Helarchaeota archaeon]